MPYLDLIIRHRILAGEHYSPEWLEICDLWGVSPAIGHSPMTPPEFRDFMRGIGMKGRNGVIRGGVVKKPELSENDLDLIQSDEILRRKKKHLKTHWGCHQMEHEYLDFLLDCSAHARRVGDTAIAAKIAWEYQRWEEVGTKDWNWSDIWSREKPVKKRKKKAVHFTSTPSPNVMCNRIGTRADLTDIIYNVKPVWL